MDTKPGVGAGWGRVGARH